MAFRIARMPNMNPLQTERIQPLKRGSREQEDRIRDVAAEEAVATVLSLTKGKPAASYSRELFHPKPRGDLGKALESAGSLARIAPESPRPSEMLESVTVTGDDRLTAQDLALHELLVAHAYQTALEAAGSNRGALPELGETEIPMRDVLTYLGPSTRRQHVRKSLKTLRRTEVSYGLPRGRHFEDVPLLVGWSERDTSADVVRYSLPSPVWTLMAQQRRYAYLELAAIASMSSRFGVRLYRHLASRFAMAEWDPNAVADVVEATPEEVAAWLGYVESPLHVGHLATALKRAVDDMRHVRRLEVTLGKPRRAQKRGAPIEAFTLNVFVRNPALHHVRAASLSAEFMPHVGGVDDPRYRVNQNVWTKAQGLARKRRVATAATWLSEAWLVALHEALSGEVFTDDSMRRLRGKPLLDAIRVEGPDRAAWTWAVEEITGPDLLKLGDAIGNRESARIKGEANRARFHRWKTYREGEDRKRRERKAKVIPAPAPVALSDEEARLARARARFDGDGNTIEFLAERTTDALEAAKRWSGRSWAGSRVYRVLVCYRDEGKYRSEAVGYLPMSWDDVVDIVNARHSPFEEFYVTHDADLPAELVAPEWPATTENYRYVGQPDGSVVVEVTRRERVPAAPTAKPILPAKEFVSVSVPDAEEDMADAYAWERAYLDDDREPPAFDPMTAPALEESDDIPF